MHIAEGVLSAPVLAGGAACAAAGVGVGLWKTDEEQIPRVAVLSSAFFVASLIHVPIGPSSAHLLLNGLTGLILGWAAFPALLMALLLQAVLFGFGGLTTLGVNTACMGLPAVICYAFFSKGVRGEGAAIAVVAGFLTGVVSIGLTCALVGVALFSTGKSFLPVVYPLALAHLPVMVIEGLVTASVVSFLRTVRPELLRAAPEGAALRYRGEGG